jgi:3-oxoadipate enol-lactonase
VTSQLIRTDDGVDLHVRLEGEPGRPVVMLSHSIGFDLTMWEAQRVALLPRFRVLRFDRRGHGKSGVPDQPADTARLGRDVLSILDSLGLARVAFVGISQGGMEGMWLGANAPARLDRLVIANSAPWLGMPERLQSAIDAALGPNGATALAGLAAGFLERWLDEDFRQRVPAYYTRLLRGFATMSPRGFAACAAALRDVDLRGELARISVPTLVIVGGGEEQSLQEAARGLTGAIPGARLAVIDGGGHLTALDRPVEFNRCLLEFLTV